MRTIVKALALVCLLLGAVLPVKAAPSTDTAYLWELTDHVTAIVADDFYVPASSQTDDTRIVVLVAGRWLPDQIDAGAARCRASMCYYGMFTYTKNTNTLTPGTGLNFGGNVQIREFDSSYQAAFGMSAPALIAAIVGWLEEPIIKGIYMSCFALYISVRLATGMRGALAVWTSDDTDEMPGPDSTPKTPTAVAEAEME